MISRETLSIDGLHCPIEFPQEEPFFSLVDYRNNYFTSDDPYKIIEFYNGFENRDQLIHWMTERPKGIANIHEVEGDKDIIVVIPTADFDGKYARECRENIFKGLHIVFVESGGVGDFYFNFAHNCNVGIRKAMEYNPKWVVVSGDDMYKIDDFNKLTKILNDLDNRQISVVYAAPSSYHSRTETIGQINKFAHVYYKRNSKTRILENLKKRFKITFAVASGRYVARLFFKQFVNIIDFIDFVIFSANLIKEYDSSIYDEHFINHFEDTELSFRILIEHRPIMISNYNIGSLEGMSLGKNYARDLRSVASLAYYSNKYENKFQALEMKRKTAD